MECSEAQKVRFGTHMMAAEVNDWWVKIRKRFTVAGEAITWVFSREFLRKYFLEDVRGKKEIEFLELKQRNSNVTEYASKFMKLEKYYPHYSESADKFSNCIKFENG